MDWPSLVRKYVWDEERTPYLVRTGNLTARQARSELFVYAFLLALLAGIVAAIALAGDARLGLLASPFLAVYAVTMLAAAVLLGISGHPWAAAYCVTAPVATGLAALTGAIRPGMVTGEIVVVAALSLLWLGYAARIVRITRRLRGWD